MCVCVCVCVCIGEIETPCTVFMIERETAGAVCVYMRERETAGAVEREGRPVNSSSNGVYYITR